MAGFRVHIGVATVLGAAYGGAAAWYGKLDWGPAILGAGLTALGGMLPDLDSDSGVPVRELFGLASVLAPLLALHRIMAAHLTPEQTLVVLIGIYIVVRYGLSEFFKKVTVHRGMFHSIPALIISGLAVYLLYQTPDPRIKYFLAGGVMLGFFSHLVLDEIWAVRNFKPNQFAGSALKLASPSITATATCYLILVALAGVAWAEWKP